MDKDMDQDQDRDRDMDKDKDKDRDRDMDMDKDKDKDRDRDMDKDKDKDRDKDKDLQSLAIGHGLWIDVPLPDGAMERWVGSFAGCTATEIILRPAAYIDDTGRLSKAWAGEWDEHANVEPLPSHQAVRLPRWGARVMDWPYPIPRKAMK